MPFRDELLARIPELVIGTLAGRVGGPQAVAGFQQGMLGRQRYEDERTQAEAQQAAALERQAMLDAERQEQQTYTRQRQERLDQTAADSADLQRRQALLAALEQYDADPSALAPFFNVPAEQAQAIAAPIVSRKERRAARDFVDRLSKDKRYEGHFATPEGIAALDETTVDWRGRPVKIRDIRAMAEEPMVPPKPAAQRPDVPNTTEEQHIADAIAIAEEAKGTPLTRTERAQARLKAVEEYARIRGQADDRPAESGGRPYVIPLQTAQGIFGFDTRTGTLGPRLADLKPGETAGRQIADAQTMATVIGQIIESMNDQTVGVLAGRYKTAEAAITGGDPQFAAFSAAVSTLQNTVINLRTGAQMSEPEARRILNEVPGVNLPLPTFVAKAKQSQKYFREWLKNRASVAYGRTTPDDVDRMVAPSGSVPPSNGADWVEVEPGVRVRTR